VQNSTSGRRRYPRARPDLRFVSVGGRLALDADGRPSRPVDFAHALVLTYCDGRHDARSIAHAVAGSLTGESGGTDAVQADVERIISTFDQDGLLL
jgi:hypothetical protein